MERNDILSVAIDTIQGKADAKFSKKQTSDELRAAFVELNGGSTKINPKTFRPGNELFEIVQELVPIIIEEGINRTTNPLFNLVEYRNIAAGDVAEFDVKGTAHFVVADAAAGIQGVRRQRIVGGGPLTVPTQTKAVRVYENLGRLLAGRIDFDEFVEGVAKAYETYVTDMAYTALTGITASTTGLNGTYVKYGSISEANLLTLVEHVEAATGKKATILGTKTALRKLGSSITYSAEQNTDLYNQGYLGRLSGIPCVAIPQAHAVGTDTFKIADDALWVIAGDTKPIKIVNEGDGYMILREASDTADLTNEYVYIQNLGSGVIVSEKMGYWYSIT
jgi:hypothetical protein